MDGKVLIGYKGVEPIPLKFSLKESEKYFYEDLNSTYQTTKLKPSELNNFLDLMICKLSKKKYHVMKLICMGLKALKNNDCRSVFIVLTKNTPEEIARNLWDTNNVTVEISSNDHNYKYLSYVFFDAMHLSLRYAYLRIADALGLKDLLFHAIRIYKINDMLVLQDGTKQFKKIERVNKQMKKKTPKEKRESRKIYMRDYRRRCPDKVKEVTLNYYRRKLEKCKNEEITE